MKTPVTDAFWAEFKSVTGSAATDYDVVAFGDGPAMANELAGLVVSGRKRATAGLLRSFLDEGVPVPQRGDHVIVIDGDGTPVCIYLSTEIRIGPLTSVDAAFAWDEGEGDLTREWWLAAHRDFFSREAARGGFIFHDEMETVFERFEVIWPPDVATRNQSSR